MIDNPRSIEEARKLTYGPSYRAVKFVEARCAYSVWVNNWGSSQCTRAPGHGRAGLYCKQHAKKRPADAQ